jgi:hypothetical protein
VLEAIAHGATVVAISGSNLIKDIASLKSDEAHHNKSTDGSSDDGSKDDDGLAYKPINKHAEGGWGSPMDLSDKDAQEVLNNSEELGKARFEVKDGIYMNLKMIMLVDGMDIRLMEQKT